MSKERQNKTTDFRIEIRALIIQKKISIAQLARLGGVNLNVGTLYKYLRNETEMTGANIEKILDALKAL